MSAEYKKRSTERFSSGKSESVESQSLDPHLSASTAAGTAVGDNLLEQLPNVSPPLDADFRPAWLGMRAFRSAVERAGGGVPLGIALERENGYVSTFHTSVLPQDHARARENHAYVERIVKFLLWQRGGFKVSIDGPAEIAAYVKAAYAPSGARAFDADFLRGGAHPRPARRKTLRPDHHRT